MTKLKELNSKQYVFGALFVVSNRVETLLERGIKEFNVTAKQWFLSTVLRNMFENPPTIKETSKVMGSSHQNVKQIALMLKEKGLLEYFRDPDDKRSIRLKLTDSSYPFWNMVKEKGNSFQNQLYEDIDEKDLEITRNVLNKMLINIEKIEKNEGEKK